MANKNMKKRAGIAVLAGVVTAGALGASAASLGEFNVQNLGSSEGVVKSCQSPNQKINVSWDVAKGQTKKESALASFTVSNLSAACIGGDAQMIIRNATNQPIGGTVDGVVKPAENGKTGVFVGKNTANPADVTSFVLTISGEPVSS